MLVYPIGPAFSCNLEFWVMSIYLPLGIASFHASNTQFLHLASRQKHFALMSSLKDHDSINEKQAQDILNSRWKRIIAGMERADNVERTFVFIGLGMFVQVSSYSCGLTDRVSLTKDHSLLSPSSSSSVPRSSILVTDFLIIQLQVQQMNNATTATKAGNGGSLLYGNSGGRGCMRRGCFSNPVAFAMCMDGALRLLFAVLLGRY